MNKTFLIALLILAVALAACAKPAPDNNGPPQAQVDTTPADNIVADKDSVIQGLQSTEVSKAASKEVSVKLTNNCDKAVNAYVTIKCSNDYQYPVTVSRPVSFIDPGQTADTLFKMQAKENAPLGEYDCTVTLDQCAKTATSIKIKVTA